MRVLVFEFMVGGGVADQHPLESSLQSFLKQGHFMLQAVCEDLLELGHQVVTLVDESINLPLPERVESITIERESHVDLCLYRAAVDADCILLIAPESDGVLLHYVSVLSSFASRLISPGFGFVQLTSNKWDCHRWLVDRSVPCPETLRLDGESEMIDESFFPCVAKPIVGAGSEGVQLIATAEELERIPKPVLIQRYVEGDHVSVSVIARLGEAPIILDPGRQVFDADPFGVHLKTEYPLDQRRKERAVALAMKVAKAFDRTRGYYGIDMVLAADPADDVVIEINPRLTSSYYWLRKWNGENIAAKFPF